MKSFPDVGKQYRKSFPYTYSFLYSSDRLGFPLTNYNHVRSIFLPLIHHRDRARRTCSATATPSPHQLPCSCFSARFMAQLHASLKPHAPAVARMQICFQYFLLVIIGYVWQCLHARSGNKEVLYRLSIVCCF